ncbi:caspase family protein [Leptothermofonsia sichuanensis E412]|uniref:caspase family protein n=1 Tax=Leptothermofonsia sichuanensis TaxID=2917832 RepID=UPI001CA78E47|nr:caspase domain-containing protein [Leptothermofonsia sichuanensis]QZZ22403.1 caspase family protein [Leptothermofonsia sichuanensis E412]
MSVFELNSNLLALERQSDIKPPASRVKLASPLVAQRERRTALVIGNANYAGSGRLANPIHDATDVAKALGELGFEVILLTDVTQRGMNGAIEQFNRKLRQGGVGLFYFAGHGIQVNGENYLIPIGATINREQDVAYEAVPLGKILGAMEDANNSINLVLIDACRNNPYSRNWRSPATGLAFVQAAQGTLISFATAPGKVAKDGYGGNSRNSPYTASLLQHIRTPDTPIELMFKAVRQSVMAKTNNQQTPWESSSLTGNFAFKPLNPNRSDVDIVGTPTPPLPAPASNSSVPIPSPSSPEPQRTALAQSRDDILLQLKTCRGNDGALRCEFLVTDQAQNRRVCIHGQYSRSTGSNIVDSQGMQYKANHVRFGQDQGRSSNPICQQLSRGVGVAAFMTFENVPDQAEPFALVEVIVREYGQRLLPFRFRNVPISMGL